MSLGSFVCFLFTHPASLFTLITIHSELKVPKQVTVADRPSGAPDGRRICVVTGASGFLGQKVVAALVEQGKYEVIRAMDVVAPKFTTPSVENINGNILDEACLLKSFQDVETVYHIASLIDLREEAHRQYKLRLVNVAGCQNVVNACIRKGVKKLVYTSSAAVTFDGKPGIFSEEHFEKNPSVLITAYGQTKRSGLPSSSSSII